MMLPQWLWWHLCLEHGVYDTLEPHYNAPQ